MSPVQNALIMSLPETMTVTVEQSSKLLTNLEQMDFWSLARTEAGVPIGERLVGTESTCRLIVRVSGRQKLAHLDVRCSHRLRQHLKASRLVR